MTKEELKKEAEVYSYKLYHSKAWNPGEDMLVKAYLAGAEPREKRIAELIDLIHAERKRQEQCDDIHLRKIADLEKENAELKRHIGLTVECEKAQKNGKLCLGYGGDEDEPCEQCKNCIKCECGYYQLGETEKDNQLTKAKEIIREFVEWANWQGNSKCPSFKSIQDKAEQFLNSEVENDSKEV
jgi:hypothetical protein